MSNESERFFELVHPGGPGGIIKGDLQMREQDAVFEPGEFYAVVFFPKITGIGPAKAYFYGLSETLSNSPEAARARFMDCTGGGGQMTWETYHDAGHRIRKVLVTDLGDAPEGNSLTQSTAEPLTQPTETKEPSHVQR